jgi:cystathionine gamma-synthase/cystathionine gamma-lyase/cystathionine beta-lyase
VRHRSLETLAVHGRGPRNAPEGSLVFPIFQGTIYGVPPGSTYDSIRYHRLSTTPSQIDLHSRLAAIEGAEAAVATSSGMAALVSCLIALLRSGDHLLAADSGYGGTMSFLADDAPRLGWSVTFIDPHRPESWDAARTDRTKAVVLETITNPLMRVPRLTEMVAFARRHGITTILDNTFASPMNFKPLPAGFDLVFHSATKYLNGHSDLVAGCVMGSQALIDRVRHTVGHFGGSLDPHAGYLLARGLKTLALRVPRNNDNALALARCLSRHARVLTVNYPGLERHPDHTYARALLTGMGGMLSFRVAGGGEAADRFLAALSLPFAGPSLGGVETLVTRPSVTSHAGMTADARAAAGITDDLVRVSAGIEGTEDLVEDFTRALDAV